MRPSCGVGPARGAAGAWDRFIGSKVPFRRMRCEPASLLQGGFPQGLIGCELLFDVSSPAVASDMGGTSSLSTGISIGSFGN
jgi:hypothetical protein